MPLRRLAVTLLSALAVLGMLGPGGPAWAHSPFEPGAEGAAEIAPGPAESARSGGGSSAPGRVPAETPGPWPALPMVAAALAFGWRQPRRAAAFALVLLLAVFAFENALHSVHHGPDQAQASSCPVAVAGAQLSATPADSVAPCDVILPAIALTPETSPSEPIAPLASTEQGRAPPPSLL